MMERLILFGAGEYLVNRIEIFSDNSILAVLDNSKARQGSTVCDIEIVSPEKIGAYEYDAIILMAGIRYVDAMQQQLQQLGVPTEKIFTTMSEYFSKREAKRIVCRGISPLQNDIVVLFPTFANSGGTRAMLYAIQVLQKKSGRVTAVSPCDGDIRRELEVVGVDTVITPDVSPSNLLLWSAMCRARTIFLNGLYYAYLIPNL